MEKHTVAFSKDSSNLFFHILTKCNLACTHCYINTDQHGTATLDIGTINKWLGLFSDRAAHTNVIFLGGEPTLHPDLHLAVKAARSLGFKSVTIDTNGYLFHNILDKISCDDIDFLSFSLDGATQTTNDAIRGKGCHGAVIKGIREAVARGFSCSMIYTVSAMNIHELELMPDLAADLGIQRFFIQTIGLRGSSATTGECGRISNPRTSCLPVSDLEVSSLQLTRDAWLDIVPKVAEKLAARGITVTYPKVFLAPDEPFECAGIVADNYFIFPNGRVYQCPICEDFALHGLEIRDNRLVPTAKINEQDLFGLTIPEGCVMNKMIQPGNLSYDKKGVPEYRIACCLLKQEIRP
jgi:MoaA/NifB/PqqE/SkfB family radical SAM enzyme